ncbi:MAG TPA: DNA replication and repair protein RecF [Chitinophagales bacterium]|nr:DNA replication and repair protein RecF [Chitinophagales bacterium]
MHLRALSLNNFRNYAEASFLFPKKVNCITGRNGSGKTNLLDAIYYLCITKSYFAATEFQNIRHGHSWFSLRGEIELNGIPHVVKCKTEKEKRKDFFLDEKRYEKLSDHVGLFPVVFITPNDVELIYGGSEERRRFLDLMLSQTDHVYLENLQEYNRLLLQRNALLRQFADTGTFNHSLLEVYDSKMVKPATLLFENRKKAIEEILPYISQTCRMLSGGKEDMSIEYESDMKHTDLWRLLAGNVERDRVLKRTAAGVHRDDLVFLMDGHIIRKFASQGQQKSFLISLKLGLFRWLKEKKQTAPFLLLDDIFDKLDAERSERLLELLTHDGFGQIFLTDTQRNRLENVFGRNNEVEFFQTEE